jgi:hypothetical protein
MSSCCDPAAADVGVAPGRCPVSRTDGKPVELRAVKALLREQALRRLSVAPHRFCADPSCDVVYFDTRGSIYRRDDLRVPVWEKEPFGARMICYCFGENERDMQSEMARTGTSEVGARIRAHIAAHRCACEVRNPRGVCCLGDVMAAAARLQRALAQESP